MSMKRSISTVLVLTLFMALPARAKSQEEKVLASWQGRLADATELLKQTDYRGALRIANKLIGEMVDRLGPGDGSTELFGLVLTNKAVAHAGLNELDEARWYYQLVTSLYPKLLERDLSEYGEAGASLQDYATTSELPASDTPPRVLKKRKPRYPHGADWFDVSGVLLVEVTITRDGRVMSPRIVQPLPAPTLSYVALEALRRWRFEPGKAHGEPVDATFTVEVNYKQ